MTVGELKDILSNVPDKTPIFIAKEYADDDDEYYDEIPLYGVLIDRDHVVLD